MYIYKYTREQCFIPATYVSGTQVLRWKFVIANMRNTRWRVLTLEKVTTYYHVQYVRVLRIQDVDVIQCYVSINYRSRFEAFDFSWRWFFEFGCCGSNRKLKKLQQVKMGHRWFSKFSYACHARYYTYRLKIENFFVNAWNIIVISANRYK